MKAFRTISFIKQSNSFHKKNINIFNYHIHSKFFCLGYIPYNRLTFSNIGYFEKACLVFKQNENILKNIRMKIFACKFTNFILFLPVLPFIQIISFFYFFLFNFPLICVLSFFNIKYSSSILSHVKEMYILRN